MSFEEDDKYIDITPEMIAAGVSAVRDFRIGEPWERIVEAVFIAMIAEMKG